MPLYIGLMSGTSMDGIDAVLVSIEAPTGRLTVIDSYEAPFPQALLDDVIPLSRNTGTPDVLGRCDHQLGCAFADAALALLAKSGTRTDQIRGIGSHGQTIRHQPSPPHAFTLQLGDPNIIAERTGITTVADFRRRDMAAGGQGAPLAPAFHRAAFQKPGEDRCLLNLGGIANLSWLPGSATDEVTGFDTGPANGLLDAWHQRHRGETFDRDGGWARTGQVNEALLAEFLTEPYFRLPAPKSTGKELFNLNWVESRLSSRAPIAAEDVQRTLLELTAITVAQQLPHGAPCTVYACGGGTRNRFLMERLQVRLGKHSLCSTDELGIAPEWIEGAAFAWLAHQTLQGLAGNLPAVTGARGERILGAIYPGGRPCPPAQSDRE